MVKVNEIVQRYRLALRDVWNHYFWVDPDLQNWESVYAYRKLHLSMFAALVAHPLDLGEVSYVFGPGFFVVPISERSEFANIQVNVAKPSRPDEGIWKPVAGPFDGDKARFTLIDFFDWSPLDYIDLRYYVVLIERLDGHEEYVGTHALVEVSQGEVIWTPPDVPT
jgi:hypothetical protein